MKDFYLDESGNTGDLINSNLAFDFAGQPYFSLTAIGINDLRWLEEQVLKLKKKHKINQPELKSTKIYKNKPEFINELVNLIIDTRIPFFIEIVDKKYFICANIVNCIVLPPYFVENNKKTLILRNIFADCIYRVDCDFIYEQFIKCCTYHDEISVLECFDVIEDYFHKLSIYSPEYAEIHSNLAYSVKTTKQDFLELKTIDPENAFKKFIPIPDENKNGKNVWLLPNLTSFTSIYARINKYSNGILNDITLFHDEQLQFDKILESAHSQLHSTEDLGEIITQSGSYNFHEKATLKFSDSKNNIAIQTSDVLSGFIMRYIQDKIKGHSNPIHEKIFKNLSKQSNSNTDIGINFVLPGYVLHSDI